MITVDSRVGSKELLPYFRPGKAQLGILDSADFSFMGKGPKGIPVMVGIERKAVGDLLQSIASGRFVDGQLPKLLSAYNVVYLLVEGNWSCSTSGTLQFRKGGRAIDAGHGEQRWMFSEVMRFLNTIEMMANVHTWKTSTMNESVSWIESIYHWWNDKEWEEHRSHQALIPHQDQVSLVKVSTLRKVAACLPNIRWKKSRLVEKHFKSVREMINASESDWVKIRGIAKPGAKRIIEAINGKE